MGCYAVEEDAKGCKLVLLLLLQFRRVWIVSVGDTINDIASGETAPRRPLEKSLLSVMI